MKMREFVYFLKYGIEYFILKHEKPIVAGISLTDICNLQCRHCVVANVGRGHAPFEKIVEWMNLIYNRGARILYLQGGEPFNWNENGKKLNDIIRTARKIGYFKIAVATNATFPIETEADVVWVSIDGTPSIHNKIRGNDVFERSISNINGSSHQNIYANMTVNSINYHDVGEIIKFVGSNKKLKGISINFHTPYTGVEDLFLPMDMRNKVIEEVIDLKKAGLPILNSISGLKALMHGNYKRPISMIQMVEKDRVFECCWEKDTGKACANCGYGIIAELSQFQKLNLGSVVHALKIFGNGREINV